MNYLKAASVSFSVLLVCCIVLPVSAQQAGSEEKERKNAVEIFLGGVTETATDATGFGVGLEYNRLLSTRWRLGIEMVEISTTEEGRSWLVVVPVYYHPIEALSLKAGPGIEGSEDKPEGGGGSESETEFAFRLGVGWEFELGPRFSLTPEVNLDLVGGSTTWVYGLVAGYHF